jgi:hypothetical protein
MRRVLAGLLIGAVLTFVFSAFAVAAPSRGVVVLLDTSGSMAPDRIVVARQAIVTYVSSLPADVQVGLVAFSSQPSLVLAPTTDRNAVAGALNQLQAKGDTSLFDAVPVGLSALQGITERRMVIVSDGEDTVSKSTVDAAVAAVAAAGVPTDVIGFQYSDQALSRIATAGGGRLLTASDTGALAAAFAALAVPSSVPPPPTAVATPEPAPAPAPVAVPAPVPGQNWLAGTLIAGTFLVVFFVVMMLLTPRRSAAGRKLERHLEHYGAQEPEVQEESQAAQTAVVWTRRVMSDVTAERLADRLDLAGIKASPAEWTLLRICASAGLAALFTLVTTWWIGIPLGALGGWLLTTLAVRMRTSKRRAAFADQLPDVLQLVASSLRSGFSLAQSIDAVVRDDTQPTAGEFSRALAATRGTDEHRHHHARPLPDPPARPRAVGGGPPVGLRPGGPADLPGRLPVLVPRGVHAAALHHVDRHRDAHVCRRAGRPRLPVDAQTRARGGVTWCCTSGSPACCSPSPWPSSPW